MSHNATQFTNESSELSVKQTAALQHLLTGENISQTAIAVGVHRSTVHRWLADPGFIAEMNGCRMELHDHADARLLNLTDRAVDGLAQAIEDGNVTAALALLRGLGLLPGQRPPVGLTDPSRIAIQQKIQRGRDEWNDEVGLLGI